jgi:uncharacterized membrane protein YdjX (TVP38/TMEM64 family)
MFEWTPKKLYIGEGIGAGALVAICSFFLLHPIFELEFPDCAPHQIDGQCGLGTAVQGIFSACGALIVWPIASFLLVRYLLRRLARKTVQAK